MAKPVIVTRAGKGSALTWTEGDTNLTNLQNATIGITDGTTSGTLDLNDTLTFTAGTNVTLSYNSGTKALTVNATGGGITDLVQDTTPQLGGNLDVNGQQIVSVSNGNIIIAPDGTGIIRADKSIQIQTQGELRLADGDSSHYVGFKGPASIASNLIWTLPNADGTNGQVLSTNGTGTLSWATASGGASAPSVPVVAFAISNYTTLISGTTFRIGLTEEIDTENLITLDGNSQFTWPQGTYKVTFPSFYNASYASQQLIIAGRNGGNSSTFIDKGLIASKTDISSGTGIFAIGKNTQLCDFRYNKQTGGTNPTNRPFHFILERISKSGGTYSVLNSGTMTPSTTGGKFGDGGWSGGSNTTTASAFTFGDTTFCDIGSTPQIVIGSGVAGIEENGTVEFWFKFTHSSSNFAFFSSSSLTYNAPATSGITAFYRASDQKILLARGSGTGIGTIDIDMGTVSPNTWYHIAMTSSGSTQNFYAWINGVYKGTVNRYFTISSESKIGSAGYTSSNGSEVFFSDFRISYTNRYTNGVNFTPPSASFTHDADTMFLMRGDTNNANWGE